jgi:hypothetical protein
MIYIISGSAVSLLFPLYMLARQTWLARLLTTPCASQVPQLSTTHRGTAFEERSLKILGDHMSMSLRRVGGKSDGGIDLLGWWWLPQTDLSSSESRRRIRVIAQCKAERKKTSPKYVREMEGVLHRFVSLPSPVDPETHDPSTSRSHSLQYPLVALLISESPFTKSTVLRAQSSPVPFFLLHIPPVQGPSQSVPDCEQPFDHDHVGTAVWNPALAGVRGLLGGEFETRWERSPSGGGRPGLWWRNEKLRSWIPETGFLETDQSNLATEDLAIERICSLT